MERFEGMDSAIKIRSLRIESSIPVTERDSVLIRVRIPGMDSSVTRMRACMRAIEKALSRIKILIASDDVDKSRNAFLNISKAV